MDSSPELDSLSYESSNVEAGEAWKYELEAARSVIR